LLFGLMQNGVLKTILAAAPRTQLIEHKQQNRLSALEMEMLAQRYNQIKSMRLVAREFGISETTVRSHLRALGITVRISKSMTELQKQKARDMWAAGMPSTLIGKKLGYSHHTILRTVRNSEYEPIVDKAQADGP
jgi:DNA-binding CsgD family transcriptional regulator